MKRRIGRQVAMAVLWAVGGSGLGGEDWEFAPPAETLSGESLLDLRYLNEAEAGETGWVGVDAQGDFRRGDGEPIRFWAVNTHVEREKPYNAARNDPSYQREPLLAQFAPWLAKRGVNMIRLHAHINPDADTQELTGTNPKELEWIWRNVAAMKAEGIYSTVSPYWPNTMESNDARWGTDWAGQHHAAIYFEPNLQAAYKEWLRVLFKTPTPLLGGKTLAEEPALAIFQIQNEDSLLFWTINNLKAGQKSRFGKMFGDWALAKYGSWELARAAWNNRFTSGDNYETGVLAFANIYEMTSARKPANDGVRRLEDQLQFWVEHMRAFYAEIARYVREDLGCPVLINASNWKTADTLLLNDAERYSMAVTEVVAVNRYFTGVHQGPNDGWAVVNGDQYTEASALAGAALDFPLNLKQVAGKPMLVTESTWVTPTETAYEGPLLVAAYGALTGFDGYFWFSADYDGFEPPRSANGWLPSQKKWICLRPDVAGQWPAAALAYRRGDVRRGDPVVEEHRALGSIYARKSPILAETASFDPNRDSGDLPPESPLATGVTPFAFLAGPVTATYGSSEANTRVAANLGSLVVESAQGAVVRSNTGELRMDTAGGQFTVDTPRMQGWICRGPGAAQLGDVDFVAATGRCAVTAISLDGMPLGYSRKILVQVGAEAHPKGWQTRNVTITADGKTLAGKEVVSYGGPPWVVRDPGLTVTLRHPAVKRARVLDANGMAGSEVALEPVAGGARWVFPAGALYVLVEAGESYESWREGKGLPAAGERGRRGDDPDGDGRANLLEFIMGTDPEVADSRAALAGKLVRQGEAGLAEVRFQKRAEAMGAELVLEVSPDGEVWTRVQFDGVEGWVEVLETEGGIEHMRARVAWGTGERVKFFRLRAESRE